MQSGSCFFPFSSCVVPRASVSWASWASLSCGAGRTEGLVHGQRVSFAARGATPDPDSSSPLGRGWAGRGAAGAYPERLAQVLQRLLQVLVCLADAVLPHLVQVVARVGAIGVRGVEAQPGQEGAAGSALPALV